MFILRLETAAEKFSDSKSKELNSAILWSVTGFCLVWSIGELFWNSYQYYSANYLNLGNETGESINIFFKSVQATISQKAQLILGPVSENSERSIWDGILPSIIYLSIVATALTNYIQTLGQRYIRAERASIIYSMDPVYGAIFSRLFLGEGEILGPLAITGATLVTGAAVLSNVLSMKEKTKSIDEG